LIDRRQRFDQQLTLLCLPVKQFWPPPRIQSDDQQQSIYSMSDIQLYIHGVGPIVRLGKLL